MDVLGQAGAVAQRQLGLVVRQHRVGEGGGHGDQHPPEDAGQELAAVAADQGLDDGAVHGRHLEADEGADDQEEAVANEQARLLAPPAGHDDAEQAQQRAEEVAVELDPLLPVGVVGVAGGRRGGADPLGALGGFAGGRRLLLGDGVAHAVDQGDEQRDVDGARDAGAVAQVHGRELRDDAADGAAAHGGGAARGDRLRLCRRHCGRRRRRRRRRGHETGRSRLRGGGHGRSNAWNGRGSRGPRTGSSSRCSSSSSSSKALLVPSVPR